MRGWLFDISDEQFKQLYEACRFHNHGYVSQDATIGACWDADRMDLRRIGIVPESAFFSSWEVRRTLSHAPRQFTLKSALDDSFGGPGGIRTPNQGIMSPLL
jgi:hypothetical protein